MMHCLRLLERAVFLGFLLMLFLAGDVATSFFRGTWNPSLNNQEDF